ncbi:hypothetical protein Tco_0557446, partial [Tanacetum coccineum]
EKYKIDTDVAGESPVQKLVSKNEQALKNILDKMMDQEKEGIEQSDAFRKYFEAQCNKELFQTKATRASSTNSFNTVSTPVNAASTPRTSIDVGPSFVLLGGSFPLNINDLLDDPLMSNLENTVEVQNTGIFGSAYNDDDLDTYNSPYADQVMGAEANFNNMEPSNVVSRIPTTRVRSIHLKNQIIGDLRIEAIRLFLDYASFMNFVVYQMDVKSAFSMVLLRRRYMSANLQTLSTYLLDNGFYRGQIDKTLFIKRVKGDILLIQMSSMGELTFFLGLQVKQKEDGIFTSQDKYVGEILKKFGFSSIRTAITPIETNKTLTKDKDGEDVDVHLYRSMIGSLRLSKAVWLDLGMDTSGSPRRQDIIGSALAQTRSKRVLKQPIEPPFSEGHTSGSEKGIMEHQFELTANVPITPHDSPLPGGYTPGSDKVRLKLQELMTMCIKLSKQVHDLEKEKDAQAVEILRLKKRVKRLERKRKSCTSQPRRRKYRQVESSDDDLNEEDVSKQGRSSDKKKPMLCNC